MTGRITEGLKPRAVAVLCALRNGPRSSIQLCHMIGDVSRTSTVDLLGDLASDFGSLAALVIQVRQAWQLTDNGIAWLEDNGLRVAVRS